MTKINFGKGAIKSPPDPRNYKYEGLVCAAALKAFDWEKGFDIEAKTGVLKVENQGQSSSCVGQAISKYLEVLNILEEGFVDLSAKDMYSRIYQPQGGAYIMDGFKLAVKRGVATEKTAPSYLYSQPPDEVFMREPTPDNDEEAYLYASKSYATTTHNDLEWIAQMIRDNNGLVSGFEGDDAGWQTAFVKPPITPKWGHAVYLGKAKIINGKKMIGFLNSWNGWGLAGWGWFDASYLGNLFDLWVLVDKINNPINKTMKIIGDGLNKKDQFVVGEDKKIYLIYNLETLQALHNLGVVNRDLKVDWTDISIYNRGEDLVAIKG